MTLWTIVPQAPLYMEFSRQEYWTRFRFPSPGGLPDPGIEPVSLTTPALADGFFTTITTWVGFPAGSKGKESACSAGDLISVPDQEEPLEKGMATYCSILTWRVLWTEKPGGLQSMGLQRIRQN